MIEIDLFRNEREQKILHDAMERLDMSAEGVVRHWCRMGQLVEYYIRQGTDLGFLNDQGDFDSIFHVGGPKMAPMAIPEDLNRWDDEGGATPKED